MEYKVVLNIYDLSPANKYLSGVGLGFYHTGVEVNGREYSYGGSPEMTSTGVFDQEPLSLDQEMYRGSVEMGTITNMTEFYRILSQIKKEFPANEYNVVRRNCNHFASEFCRRLVGRDIPGYLNRMAYFGYLCSCLLPKSLKEQDPIHSNNEAATASSVSSSYQYNNIRGGTASAKMEPVGAFKGKGKRL